MNRLMKSSLVLVALLAVLAGCDRSAEQCLLMAEERMESEPISAYKSLSELEEVDKLSAEQQARYALLYTQAMDKCNIPLVGNDSLINIAVRYFTQHNKRHYAAKSLLYKGIVHMQYENRNLDKAAKAFAQSVKWFKGVEDNQYKAMLYRRFAILKSGRGQYRDALPYYKNAYFYCYKLKSIPDMLRACGEVAHTYEHMRDMENAKAYYEEGLQYKDKVPSLTYYSFLNNYANFLRKNKEYEKAEQMMLECEQHITTRPLYRVHINLANLYYDMGEYDKALVYTDKILQGQDDSVLPSCYNLLYRMHHQQGLYDEAEHYYELYRECVNENALQNQRSKEIEIPIKQKNVMLMEENRTLSGWRLWLTVGIVVTVVASGIIYMIVKRRHCRFMLSKEQALTDASINLGQLKGAMTNQANVVERLRKALGEMKKEHRDEINRMKDGIKSLEADIKELKGKERENGATEEKLKRQLAELDKQLKRKTEEVGKMELQRVIDLRIDYFVMHGRDSVPVDMLLQLRYGDEVQARYDIRPSEYLPMLQNLLEDENPDLHHKLEGCELNRGKLTMCYLIALGLDDMDMMARAACLAPNSVKAYRKECRELVETLQ